jgi:hypothetical protein
MLEIITQLIAASIDPNKIPSFYCFDMFDRSNGKFKIVLNDGTQIEIGVAIDESGKN